VNERGSTDRPDAAPQPDASAGSLDAYMAKNRARFTEDALRRAALDAGNPHEAVDAAIARTRPLERAGGRARVSRNLFLAYLAVYLVLDALMLINPNNGRDSFVDARVVGIVFLSISLGLSYIASLVWIASRRLFWGILGLLVAASGAVTLNSSSASLPLGLVLLVAGGSLMAAVEILRRRGSPAPASTGVLLSMPLLLLLAVGGACVASGLPLNGGFLQ